MSTFDDEKRMQPFMDTFYTSIGCVVDRSKSCVEYDCIIGHNGRQYKIEEKFLFTDKDYEQGLIEIIQDLARPSLGWFYHTRCDYLLWIYCREDRINRPRYAYSMNWAKVKLYTLACLSNVTWNRFNLCNDNFGLTLNYPISWSELLANKIAKRIELGDD